jgi:hypothetical protein
MNTTLLIHAIMRQTTVLIAELSTAAGIRAPLAHLADQVFVNLAKEIEAQGVGRKVAADMFGLALRTYQTKVQRLTESATAREMTLWQAVLKYLRENGSTTRTRLFERFRNDPENHLRAVLNDLVTSGLVYATGRSDSVIYGITSEVDQNRVLRQQDVDSVAAMIWLNVCHQPQTIEEAKNTVAAEPAVIQSAIETLIDDGRVQLDETCKPALLRAETFLVPVGSEKGWEAAVFDHFRTVTNAIAAKARAADASSAKGDLIGGATIYCDVYPGHPMESEVYGLLEKVRGEMNELWSRVAGYNKDHPVDEKTMRTVSFYFGQNVRSPLASAS